MKLMGFLTSTVLAAAFTAGVILMAASTPSMAHKKKKQQTWDHYQTRTYKGGSKTEWYVKSFTDPVAGKNQWLLKMDFYDAKGKLKKTNIGLVGANPKDGDIGTVDWDVGLKLPKKKGEKLRITPEFAKTPFGKYLIAKGAGLVTVVQPSGGGKPVSAAAGGPAGKPAPSSAGPAAQKQ